MGERAASLRSPLRGWALTAALIGCGGPGAASKGTGAGTGAGTDAGSSAAGSGSGTGTSTVTAGTGAGSSGAGSSGGGGLSACTPPPPASYDPLAAWDPPRLTADVVVTSTADDGPGSLRMAVANASDGQVVGFAAELAGQTIVLASTVELTRSVTLDGEAAPGISVDGAGAVGLFHFNGDAPTTLRLFGLRLRGGLTDGSGGALSANGGALDVEIGGCSFDGNSSSEGGAIRVGYAKGSKLWIHHSVFQDNDGSRPGPGNGFSGGAVSATGTYLRVDHCRFESNVGPTVGALYAIHSDPVVEDSVFLTNKTSRSDGGAGGFFVDGGGPGDDNQPGDVPGEVTLRRVRFQDNEGAGSDGGGIMLWGYPKDQITVEDAVFVGNRCTGGGKGGGAKLHARNQLALRRVAFVDNVSDQQGGGIWMDGEGPFVVENVLFAGNEAVGDRGGGATLNVAGRVDLVYVTFAENRAGQGAAAFWLPSADADVHLRGGLVAFNTAPNAWEIQVGYPPIDDGGNLEWPEPGGGGSRVAAGGLLVDPLLLPLEERDGTWVRPLAPASPAVDATTPPAPGDDQRGAPRDAAPDIGAFEAGATCEG